MYNRPVVASLVVGDFFFNGFNKRHFIVLFHCIFKCETIVGSNISGKHEVVNFVESTVVQLIHLMKLIQGFVWCFGIVTKDVHAIEAKANTENSPKLALVAAAMVNTA